MGAPWFVGPLVLAHHLCHLSLDSDFPHVRVQFEERKTSSQKLGRHELDRVHSVWKSFGLGKLSKNTLLKNTLSKNTLSKNTLSEKKLLENTLLENTLSKNTLSENTLSKNTLSENTLSENKL